MPIIRGAAESLQDRRRPRGTPWAAGDRTGQYSIRFIDPVGSWAPLRQGEGPLEEFLKPLEVSQALDPLIKSRGAVTSRPSVFLLTSAQLRDQARSPTRVIHDTGALSRHKNRRCHAPERTGSLKITQGRRSPARALDYSTGGSVRQRLPDHANHSTDSRLESRCRNRVWIGPTPGFSVLDYSLRKWA